MSGWFGECELWERLEGQGRGNTETQRTRGEEERELRVGNAECGIDRLRGNLPRVSLIWTEILDRICGSIFSDIKPREFFMPGFKVSVPHRHDTVIIAQRLRMFADKLRGQMTVEVSDLVEEWDSEGNLRFAFRTKGMQVSGKLENRLSEVLVTGTIPFLALPFRGMIEDQLAEKIREAIEIANE